MPGLLGNGPSRKFKIYREVWPAIFRFNGKLFQEVLDLDANEHRWHEISEHDAGVWLEPRAAIKPRETNHWTHHCRSHGEKLVHCYGPTCSDCGMERAQARADSKV